LNVEGKSRTGTNEVATFGSDTPLGRPGAPEEVATCFVFLAPDDSSYITPVKCRIAAAL
jgi:NAD(P)-dependent dehydrogenase (short-subunit alcohol dehydrogenase family)